MPLVTFASEYMGAVEDCVTKEEDVKWQAAPCSDEHFSHQLVISTATSHKSND